MRTIAVLLSLLLSLFADAETPRGKIDVTFIVTADTHIKYGVGYAQTHALALSAMKDATTGQRLTWPDGMTDEGQPIPQPAAVFIAGDLSYDGLLRPTWREWEMFRKLYLDRTTSLLKMPVFPGAGNHDVWAHINTYQIGGADVVNSGVSSLIEKSWAGSSVFKFAPGVSTGWWHPPHYAVSLGDGQLLVVQLNTSIGEPCRSGTKAGNHGTYLEPTDPQCDAFAWLRNLLSNHRAKFGADAPVILIQHMGYDGFGVGTDNEAYRGYWWAPEYRRQLAETIAPYHVIAFIHGHTHIPSYVKPGTTYTNDAFGSDLSSPVLVAGDAEGRAWTNIIDKVPEYCRALSATGQVSCTQAGGSGKEVTSGAFDLGDKLGRGWINVEADIKPNKKYADYCRVLTGSTKIACNRRDASGFIGDTVIHDTGDAGWTDSRVWVKLSPSIPGGFCRVTGTSADRSAVRRTPTGCGEARSRAGASTRGGRRRGAGSTSTTTGRSTSAAPSVPPGRRK